MNLVDTTMYWFYITVRIQFDIVQHILFLALSQKKVSGSTLLLAPTSNFKVKEKKEFD